MGAGASSFASKLEVGRPVWWLVRWIRHTIRRWGLTVRLPASSQGEEHGSGVPDLRPEFGIGVWGSGRLRLLA